MHSSAIGTPSSPPRRRGTGRARPTALVVLVVALAAGLSGCGLIGSSGQGAAPGETAPTSPEVAASGIARGVEPAGHTIDATISVGGRDRSYHLYVPASLPTDRPVPLLVALHGGTGWGTQFEADSGFDRLAEANGFLVVYPDGVGVGAGNDRLRTWNAGMCCGSAQKDQIDDVAFVSALIDGLGGVYQVDPSRTFVTGHSNGAMLSYRVACELSDKVAAIAVVAGTLGVDDCRPSRPVSVMEVHGTADQNIPIDGGQGDRSLTRVDFPSPRASVATMAGLAGCGGDPTITSAGDLTTTNWSSCDAGTAVRLVAITGATHAWPGSAPTRLNVAGPPYPLYDASTEIWAFLAAHPRAVTPSR